MGSLESLSSRALGPVNWAIGAWYVAWVAAVVIFPRRRVVAAMVRLGAIVGLAVLATGIAGSVMNDKAVGRLVWPGVVYPATAMVIWIRRPRKDETKPIV
ncbi:MAG: hypothetical protein PHU85_11025 [Phycisphaerae bacterium]|nr:hypothetical protein [Phycisphaerae bacterium]